MNKVILLLITLFPIICLGSEHNIHIEWGYTPPTEPAVSGFKLYQEGDEVCSTNNNNATSMDCDVSIVKDTTSYTLTATFVDGSESPHSTPYLFKLVEKEINIDSGLFFNKIQVRDL